MLTTSCYTAQLAGVPTCSGIARQENQTAASRHADHTLTPCAASYHAYRPAAA